MNERIFKLALKAMDFQGAVDIDTELKLTNSELEKFAELIVAECVRVCVADMADPRDSVELRCAKKIQKHFGVKE
jgi:hypothetical protein